MPPTKREDLHHNFLKKIIVKLDFQGVLESEMECILSEIKPYVKEKGFTRYTEKMSDQVDISILDIRSSQPIAEASRVKSQRVYSFIDETRGYVLDISSNFICLAINATRYTPFESYGSYLPEISKIYAENIDFFTTKRLGLRKINECLIQDKALIKRYFSSAYFGFFDELEGVDTLQSRQMDSFKIKEYNVNLMSNVNQGTADGRTLYSVRLDIDAYLDNSESIDRALSEPTNIQGMNDLLFEIYVRALTDEFIAILSSEDVSEIDGIIGIAENE